MLRMHQSSYLIRETIQTIQKYCLNARNSRSKGVLIGLEVREFERRRAEWQVFPCCQKVILAKMDRDKVLTAQRRYVVIHLKRLVEALLMSIHNMYSCTH